MSSPNAEALIFRSKRGGSILETTLLNQGLYPALKALGYRKAGCTGFDGDATGDWNLPESTLSSSANKWDIAPTA